MPLCVLHLVVILLQVQALKEAALAKKLAKREAKEVKKAKKAAKKEGKRQEPPVQHAVSNGHTNGHTSSRHSEQEPAAKRQRRSRWSTPARSCPLAASNSHHAGMHYIVFVCWAGWRLSKAFIETEASPGC